MSQRCKSHQGGEQGDWQHAIGLLETMRVLVVPRGSKHSNQSSYKHRREILRGEYQTKSELENENHHFQAQYVRDFWFYLGFDMVEPNIRPISLLQSYQRRGGNPTSQDPT